jgi:hypothetical protein
MCYCKDRFFERLSLASLLHVVDPEGGIMLDNTVCHQPDHSPEVPVTPALISCYSLRTCLTDTRLDPSPPHPVVHLLG